MRSTIRAYWTAWTAVGVEFDEARQVGPAADRLELVAPLERLRDRDDVDRLAPLEQLEDRLVDRAVRLAVEVRGAQELGDLDDRVTVDEDRAEHRLLGLETLRRQAIDHGHPRSDGGLCQLECQRRRLRPIRRLIPERRPRLSAPVRPVESLWTTADRPSAIGRRRSGKAPASTSERTRA